MYRVFVFAIDKKGDIIKKKPLFLYEREVFLQLNFK